MMKTNGIQNNHRQMGSDKPPIVWEPKENCGLQMKKFIQQIEKKYPVKINDYLDLYQWSIDNIPEFWAEVWEFGGIVYSEKYHEVINLNIPIDQRPKWFEGAKLNYAENLLRYRDDGVALIISGEDRGTEKYLYSQMHEDVALYAAALRKIGFKRGNVAACYMSNRKEAVLAMLAVVSIGGIWTGALPQLGVDAVLSRISQVSPKVLFTIDRFSYNRKEIEMLEKLEGIVKGLPCLEKVIIVPSKVESKLKDIRKIPKSCFLDDFLESGREKDGSVQPLVFEQVSMSYPVFINFTSGTTGSPKPLVHGSGILVSIVKEYSLHFDSSRDSVWLSMSSVGWVTWNIFASLLFLGETVVLFEGVAHFLSQTFFWDMVDDIKISHLFLSASVVDEFQKRKYLPTEKHSLESVKMLMAGGSVVKPSCYDFMYKTLREGCFFSSAYGSTEFIGSLFAPTYCLPVYRGEINSTSLGSSIQCLNDEGEPVLGEVGELFLTKPLPNNMLGIWGDADGSKFREKYCGKHPGKFQIGDFAIMNPVTNGVIICGRSDDTIKQRGCRFGSSEIYNIVEHFPEVRDSLCVSHYNSLMDERAVLFLKMRDGHRFEDTLVNRIRDAIATDLTPRHVPDVIIEAGDIPYSMNGKKMEILVKNIINNKPCITDSVSNQDSLKYYRNRKELQDF